MDLEFRELKYFMTVVNCGTLTSAAEMLFVSQPCLTKVIQKLETAIGAPLFIREKNQLKITDVGQELYNKSKVLINNYEKLCRGISDIKNVDTGYISIGLPPCTIPLFFHQTFLEYKSSHPNVTLKFVDNGRDAVINGILNGDIDLGITVQEYPNEKVEEIPIYYSDMIAVVHKDHPLSGLEEISFSQLSKEPLCILQENYLIAKQTICKCHAAGFTPVISCTNSNCEFLIQMAQAQKHVAIIPRPTFAESGFDDMVAIPFSDPWPWIICLTWKKNAYLTHATQQLKDLLISRFI